MGRSVLVTGGNRGIGLAIASAFADDGDDVAITYRTGTPPEGFLAAHCDVTDPETVETAFAEVEQAHGPVEVLVANAGVTRDTLLLRMGEEDWSSVIETNLTGSFRVAKRAARGMLRLRRGRIVFISSVVGLFGSAGNITANVVAPGFVETDMTSQLPADRRAEYVKAIPLNRYATADEVAFVTRWLASKEAAYITGAVIPVDGGLGMGH